MTFAFRNTLLIILEVLCLLLILSTLGFFFYAVQGDSSLQFTSEEGVRLLWWTYQSGNTAILIRLTVFASFACGLYSFITLHFLRLQFKRTVSPEIFFACFYVFAFTFELIKIPSLFLSSQGFDLYIGSLLTRTHLAGHAFGIICLFLATIFAAGLNYQKYGSAILLSLLISFLLGYAVPIETLERLHNGLYLIGDRTGFLIFFSIVEFFCMLNLIQAFRENKQKEYLFAFIGSILLIIGREGTFFSPNTLIVILSIACLTIGMIVFARSIKGVYLWRL
ncbi:MAG: hypothetical protein ACLFR1_02335 [Spirochaetia bacterium]